MKLVFLILFILGVLFVAFMLKPESQQTNGPAEAVPSVIHSLKEQQKQECIKVCFKQFCVENECFDPDGYQACVRNVCSAEPGE